MIERTFGRKEASLWLGLMLVTVFLAESAARHLLPGVQAVADLKHHVDYSAGLKLPVAVIGSTLNGWPLLTLVWAMVAALGFLGWRFSSSLAGRGRYLLPAVIAAQVTVALCLSLFPLTLSGDPYAYVIWGRLYGVHGLNPYFLPVGVSAGPDNSLAAALAFYGNPPPSDDHGPLWTLMAGLVSMLERGSSLWGQIWTHRLLSIAGAVGTSLALARILRKSEATARHRLVAAFAFSPLVMYESAIGGHNDTLMIAMAAWAFALVDDYPLIAGLLLGASMGVKYVSVIALPFLALRAWRQRPLAGVLCALAATLVIILTFKPFWLGTPTLYALVGHGGVFAMSPTWLANYYFFSHHMAAAPVLRSEATLPFFGSIAWPRAVQLLFLAAFGGVTALAWRRYCADLRPGRLWAALTAFIWAAPIIHPWYVLWLSPAIACAGRWSVFAWWFGLLIFTRYALDVNRPFGGQWVFLAALTLVFLFAPIIVARMVKVRPDVGAAAAPYGSPL